MLEGSTAREKRLFKRVELNILVSFVIMGMFLCVACLTSGAPLSSTCLYDDCERSHHIELKLTCV